MQWLIDLIISRIGIPPVFIDRGDPAEIDFGIDDFTRDGVWHELDLSTIVPAGATAVLISVWLKNTETDKFFMLRKHGNTETWSSSVIATQVSNVYFGCDFVCVIDADRKADYLVSINGWTEIYFTVKGWWL